MALVYQATCPKCGQVHMVTGMRSVYVGPAVEVCGECLVREAEEALYEARRTAYEAAGRTEAETLRNIERFWNEVRKEVES